MQTVLAPGSTNNTRRIFAFLAVVAIHVLLIWGINAGLTDIIKERVLGNLQTVEIAAPEEEEERPPPPPPKMETPPPFVPPPEISIELPVVENSTAIQSEVTTVKPVQAAPVISERKVVDIGPKANPKRPLANCNEYYPNASIRAEEEATLIVNMSVAEDGRVVDARIAEPSKYPRLEEAALKCVKTWRFLPATRDGVPVASTLGYKIKFELKGK